MNLVLGILAAACGVLGGWYLIRAERIARTPSEPELHRTPLYVEQGGARFNDGNWTIPFVRIAAFDDLVVISCVTHHLVLRPGDVAAIQFESHLFSSGLPILHHRSDIPRELILWQRNVARLRVALEQSLLSPPRKPATSQ